LAVCIGNSNFDSVVLLNQPRSAFFYSFWLFSAGQVHGIAIPPYAVKKIMPVPLQYALSFTAHQGAAVCFCSVAVFP